MNTLTLSIKQKFFDQIKSGEITKEQLVSLKDKRLGCFCKPLACHGDVIKEAVKWAIENRAP